MCDDVACLFWNRFYFYFNNVFVFFRVILKPECSFKSNLGNIKFVYLDAHYLVAHTKWEREREI